MCVGEWASLRSRNTVGDAGAVILARAISHNRALEEINLRSNGLTDASAASLADMLGINHTLTSLQLTANTFTLAGGMEIARGLACNDALVACDVLHTLRIPLPPPAHRRSSALVHQATAAFKEVYKQVTFQRNAKWAVIRSRTATAAAALAAATAEPPCSCRDQMQMAPDHQCLLCQVTWACVDMPTALFQHLTTFL